MEQKVDVAIIGASNAGHYAYGQLKRRTDSCVLIDGGELGTTCGRVGCMPSKALIQVAERFHRCALLDREGIVPGDGMRINDEDVLEHVQGLRDIFVDKVLSSTTDDMDEELIAANARFLEPVLLEVDGRLPKAADASSGDLYDTWRRADREQQVAQRCGTEMSATQACVSHHRSPAPRPRRYRARRSSVRAPLYQAVQHHLESWLGLATSASPSRARELTTSRGSTGVGNGNSLARICGLAATSFPPSAWTKHGASLHPRNQEQEDEHCNQLKLGV